MSNKKAGGKMIEKLYTVEEVAELASVTGRTIRNYLKSGRLVGRKIGGQWRFPESEVQRLLTGGASEEGEPQPSPQDSGEYLQENISVPTENDRQNIGQPVRNNYPQQQPTATQPGYTQPVKPAPLPTPEPPQQQPTNITQQQDYFSSAPLPENNPQEIPVVPDFSSGMNQGYVNEQDYYSGHTAQGFSANQNVPPNPVPQNFNNNPINTGNPAASNTQAQTMDYNTVPTNAANYPVHEQLNSNSTFPNPNAIPYPSPAQQSAGDTAQQTAQPNVADANNVNLNPPPSYTNPYIQNNYQEQVSYPQERIAPQPGANVNTNIPPAIDPTIPHGQQPVPNPAQPYPQDWRNFPVNSSVATPTMEEPIATQTAQHSTQDLQQSHSFPSQQQSPMPYIPQGSYYFDPANPYPPYYPYPMPYYPYANPVPQPTQPVTAPAEDVQAKEEEQETDSNTLDHKAKEPELSDVGKKVTRFLAEVHNCSSGPQVCAVFDVYQSFSAAKAASEHLNEIAAQESESDVVCQSFVEYDERVFIARYTLFGTSVFLQRCLNLIG